MENVCLYTPACVYCYLHRIVQGRQAVAAAATPSAVTLKAARSVCHNVAFSASFLLSRKVSDVPALACRKTVTLASRTAAAAAFAGPRLYARTSERMNNVPYLP